MEAWLNDAGAKGLKDLELVDFPNTGRGVKTRRGFKEGETVLTIPGSALWTVDHAYSDPLLGPAFKAAKPPLSDEDILATYILFVRSRESGYDGMRSHVAALPASYSSSIFFADDELEVCNGSSLHAVTKQVQGSIKGDYRDLVIRLLQPNPKLFPLDKFTIEDYKWAMCTVWSRSMDFALPTGQSIRLLAPFADMLNHSSSVKQCHAYNPSSGSLSILPGKDYKAGDQVFIFYGPVPNNRLLRLYGFIIPDNPHDSYDLVLSTHPYAQFFEQKQKLWAAVGLEETSTIPLTLTNPLPDKVLKYLRIQRLGVDDIGAIASGQIDASRKISDNNEIEILSFLVGSIENILRGFSVQLEKLEKQLEDNVYPAGGNAWAAAHVSLGEQRVLRLTRERARILVVAAMSGAGQPKCAKCGKRDVPLSSCGRCKAVRYCGRTCQVAHHPEHKAACRATAAKNA